MGAGLPPAVQLSAALSLPMHGRVAEGHKRAVGQAVPEDACQLDPRGASGTTGRLRVRGFSRG